MTIRKLIPTAAAALILGLSAGAAFAGDAAPMPSTASSPALTLTVVAPNGVHFRMGLVAGQGWQYLDPAPAQGLVKVASNGTTPASSEIGGEQPQSVFIDGPTGYMFTWNAGRGWHFIGHVERNER